MKERVIIRTFTLGKYTRFDKNKERMNEDTYFNDEVQDFLDGHLENYDLTKTMDRSSSTRSNTTYFLTIILTLKAGKE